jgi:thiol-disulfide isomerase/thioredoxin
MSEKKTDRLTSALVGLLLVGAVLMGWQEVSNEKLLKEASQAPDFSVEAFVGGQVSLAALKGTVVLVDFWATWCGPCREEMPMLVRVAKEYESRGVRLVAIDNDDLNEQKDAVTELVGRQPQLGPFAAFGTPELSERYLVRALPTLYVVDRQGAIVASEVGTVSEGQLRRWIEKALARQ